MPNNECIQYELPSNGRRIAWLFQVDGKAQEYAGEAGYSCSDDVLGGLTLATRMGRCCFRPTHLLSSRRWQTAVWLGGWY